MGYGESYEHHCALQTFAIFAWLDEVRFEA